MKLFGRWLIGESCDQAKERSLSPLYGKASPGQSASVRMGLVRPGRLARLCQSVAQMNLAARSFRRRGAERGGREGRGEVGELRSTYCGRRFSGVRQIQNCFRNVFLRLGRARFNNFFATFSQLFLQLSSILQLF